MSEQIETRAGGPPAWPFAIAGVVAAGAGLLLGLLPVAATGGGTCGSPFAPASHGVGMTNALIDTWCSGDLSTRRWLAVALIAIGLVIVGIAAKLWRDARAATTPEPVSVSGELERLAHLRASGALSEDEFAAAKSRALAQEDTRQPGVGGQ